MKNSASLLLFLCVVVGGGLTIGLLTAPGEWYLQLSKPSFNPPGWVFGPVWTAIYICIAIAGWRIWAVNRAGTAMKLWAAQLALNFAWSPTFFSAHQIGSALIIIVILLATIVAFILYARSKAPLSAWLFAPYAAWVSFATALNTAILILN